jgi:NAD(P)-dependent dehydrogenase (short-subunit alcohol dehydrogenase family)
MSDPFDLSATRALITGAGRGIGAEIARSFAKRGASVAVTARTTSEIKSVASIITEEGGRAVSHRLDVSTQTSVDEVKDWAANALGGPINTLVNNAGVYTPNRFLDYTIDQWHDTLEVNVIGAVRMCQAFLPEMLDEPFGRIINIASTAGKYGSLNQSAYNTSKHALVGLTRCLALETAATGVRVNAICPGFVDTDLLLGSSLPDLLGTDEQGVMKMIEQRTPIGRPITTEEVAALTVYLASPAADGMTGIALTLAGGLILI